MVLGVGAGGCSVFDPNLYMGGMQPPPPTGGAAERCDGAIPKVGSNTMSFTVDTTMLTSNYRAFSACVGHELPGNDGFYAVDMKANERWHVHVTGDATVDPAVYILPTCDERSCETGHGLDVCGAGGPEHLSFVAPNDGTFLVGIDSKLPGGGSFTVLIVKPTCGNGNREHSETCDDGNMMDGDGCDKSCRKELTGAAAVEGEPNDDPPGPNVMLMPDASPAVTVSGSFGMASCDVDVYGIPVLANGGLRARVVSASSAKGCAAVELALVSPNKKTVLRASGTPGMDGCQVLEMAPEAGRGAAEYYLRVSTKETTNFDYTVRVERP